MTLGRENEWDLSEVDRRVAPVPSTSPRSAVTHTGATDPGPTDLGATYPGYSAARAASLIWARGLRKSYPATGSGKGGELEAVRGIDLDVRPGEAFGFLGPNGAGKSSTMRMISAVSAPSGGELSILGMDPAADGPRIRGRLGVCPQEDTLDLELNVRDNLVVYGRYFGIGRAEAATRADELLEFVQLTEKAKA